jgi:hypothetical protein
MLLFFLPGLFDSVETVLAAFVDASTGNIDHGFVHQIFTIVMKLPMFLKHPFASQITKLSLTPQTMAVVSIHHPVAVLVSHLSHG